ncbi:alkene reductase [Sphingobium sp. TA15]|uniref:Alkene reductase n=5 Tax=Sphingomonadaceae TaxID=41297 RepID=A0A2S8B003_9SPHN|nr:MULTISPECIES: alkene reductase [Sphingomonadaceae]EPR12425.1 N-ethylmaleimide reductase [Sphingobium indicum IP26]KEY99735.1 N-ethylmaleimide reductase [Sphingomonas sp. BHC-A]MBY2930662.1 alkene reductase [Sphingomonadales bacterium 56]MBY2960654.1 alkene reductase [Sphingomonadales bacterium 58]BDD68900.1 alkene reductase [Sphingobium sp. TA15]
MTQSALFQPLRIGRLELSHRVVMAPLTRMRAGPGMVPRDIAVEYYRQRATPGGLIVAEASQVMPTGQGYPQTPGIHTAEQIAGWKRVTDAVHEAGGHIFLQLWHVGRISHSSYHGETPVAPSAVAAAGDHFTASWKLEPFQTPRALELEDIAAIVEAYRTGARNALAAGFDGVEIHGANGYLIEQFLQSRSNRRQDIYGGSIANRTRFLLDVTRAVVEEAGADRVAVRLSPFGTTNDSGEDDPLPLYRHAIAALSGFQLAYLHLIEPRIAGTGKADVLNDSAPSAAELFRDSWPGVLIAAGGYEGASAQEEVGKGLADAIAFGRPFIANPDLVERIRLGAPLNPWDRPTFYGGDAKGYTDYPTLETLNAAA